MEADRIVNEDCISWLAKQPEGFADLIFADPPFNIGYQYDVYEDRKAYDEYHAWTRDWMGACVRALEPTGTFWVAIGDEYAAEVRMIGRELGLTLRNWVMWYYTFGQNTKRKFCRSHAHLFYFVKNPGEFTFHADAVRVFSDRQREYRDKRANPKGKLPDDTWFDARVCGTFGEREGWHPCQMPESVLLRIVRACSGIGDLVFDPFGGSGTTLAAAKKLSRRWLGTELSADYVKGIRERMDAVEPLAASPAASRGLDWPAGHVRELQALYAEESVETATLDDQPHLLDAFTAHLNARLAGAGVQGEYTPDQVHARLTELRSAMQLPRIKTHADESSMFKRSRKRTGSPLFG